MVTSIEYLPARPYTVSVERARKTAYDSLRVAPLTVEQLEAAHLAIEEALADNSHSPYDQIDAVDGVLAHYLTLCITEGL